MSKSRFIHARGLTVLKAATSLAAIVALCRKGLPKLNAADVEAKRVKLEAEGAAGDALAAWTAQLASVLDVTFPANLNDVETWAEQVRPATFWKAGRP